MPAVGTWQLLFHYCQKFLSSQMFLAGIY
uniref:Uncharacterized protein n=1 Tax=Rhizophora mucronata TaxID=61149 RepID=A0A2P2MXA0_RHIMU